MSERIRVIQPVDAVDSSGSVVARLDPGEYVLVSRDPTWATLQLPDGRYAFVPGQVVVAVPRAAGAAGLTGLDRVLGAVAALGALLWLVGSFAVDNPSSEEWWTAPAALCGVVGGGLLVAGVGAVGRGLLLGSAATGLKVHAFFVRGPFPFGDLPGWLQAAVVGSMILALATAVALIVGVAAGALRRGPAPVLLVAASTALGVWLLALYNTPLTDPPLGGLVLPSVFAIRSVLESIGGLAVVGVVIALPRLRPAGFAVAAGLSSLTFALDELWLAYDVAVDGSFADLRWNFFVLILTMLAVVAFVVVVGLRTIGEPDSLAHDPTMDHPAW